jgi:hypothetical protein
MLLAVVCLHVTAALAGPCRGDITQFEAAIRRSAGNPNAGLMAPQSVGAQMDRQPTPKSLESRPKSAYKQSSRRHWPEPNALMTSAIAVAVIVPLLRPRECTSSEQSKEAQSRPRLCMPTGAEVRTKAIPHGDSSSTDVRLALLELQIKEELSLSVRNLAKR